MSERPKRALLYVLAALVFLEGVALAAAMVYLVIEILVAPTASVASAVALAVCAGIVAAGLILIAWSTLKGRPWIRGATLCWQIIQVLVAWSILQASAPGVAWSLIVPAVVIAVLLFTPSVTAATTRQNESEKNS